MIPPTAEVIMADHRERVRLMMAAKAKIQLDANGEEMEPEPEVTIITEALVPEFDELPRSPKALWRWVEKDSRWVMNAQYSETMVAAVRYVNDSEKKQKNAGDIRFPEHRRCHLWLQGVLAGSKTVAAFVTEYELKESDPKPTWKFVNAIFADSVVTEKTFTTIARPFNEWLAIFIPKETEKK